MKQLCTILFFSVFFICITTISLAQVGINTENSPPDPSAMLDVRSGDKGILIPRIALVSADSSAPMARPVEPGLMVYNTVAAGTPPNTVDPGYYYWNGARWMALSLPAGTRAGEMLYWNGASWNLIPPGQNLQDLVFCNGLPVWGGCLALVSTTPVSGITWDAATSGGDVTNSGGTQVTARGVCWSTSPSPTIQNNRTVNGTGTGVFISMLSGLQPLTTYYVRAYAINSRGTAYGNEATFTTPSIIYAPRTILNDSSACPVSGIVVPVYVKSFNNIGSFRLTLKYNKDYAQLQGIINNSGFPGLTYTDSIPSRIFIKGLSSMQGFTLPDSTVLFSLQMNYSGNDLPLEWMTASDSCAYYSFPPQTPLYQVPESEYFTNATIYQKPVSPVGISISSNLNNVCEGTVVQFTAVPVNGGTAPQYQWKKGGTDIPGATGATYIYSPSNGDVITCSLLSNAVCPTGNPAFSNAITMVVNPLMPVNVSIAVSANNICAGTSVQFTATAVNGGSAPSYQWIKGGADIPGATGATYSYLPVNGDVITCRLLSGIVCPSGNPALSNPIAMTVNPVLPVSITVTASANPSCSGTSVTYSATVVNGGANPAFQWRKNSVNVPGATGSTYSYVPLTGDVITCQVTSTAQCTSGNPAISNPVTMVVNSNQAVSVSLFSNGNPVCAGFTSVFQANPVNGGTNPSYQWRKNNINIPGATNNTYSYQAANGDAIRVVLTSSLQCTTGNPATSSQITMTVNPVLPVSVSIATPVNPVCSGNSATFTATPVNGGTTPQYQWKKNGTNVTGATTSAYTYTPANNDAITCVLTSNLQCKSGSPATSNAIAMTVNPIVAASVTISASANPVCSGSSVTFTATPVNGGPSPMYQWQVNGAPVSGATGQSYLYQPLNGDQVSCSMTSNAPCVTGSPAGSNTVTMTVNQTLPAGVTIVASENPVYAGTQVTFTATPVNGGSNPMFQWTVNGVAINGATSPAYSYVPLDLDQVQCIMTSGWICPSGSPASSNVITMTVNPYLPVSVTISESINNVCSGTPVTFTAVPVNGGVTPSYKWFVNQAEIAGATAVTFTYPPGSGDQVHCVLTSSLPFTTGNPATSNSVLMTVNPLLPVSVSIASSGNTVCTGTSVSFTAAPVNGGSSPAYQWKVNGNNVSGATGTSYSYVPVNDDAVTCQVTSNALCPTGNPATSNAITMTVNPLLPVSATIFSSANTVCAGTTVNFTSSVVNGGASPSYQWRVNGTAVSGATASGYSFVPVNGDAVSCLVTSNAVCPTGSPATSNTISINVNPLLPVSVSITSSENTVCAGTAVIFTATPVNGGTSPAYQWRVNGTAVSGATNGSYSYTPLHGDALTCLLTSGETCTSGNPALSNAITMAVNPLLPVSVSIASTGNTVCAGTSVSFTATPVNGGASPQYQWRVNGTNVTGATNASYSFVPVNGDAVTCLLTSSIACPTGNPATSNAITMTVNPLLPVSVSIASTGNTVCAGTTVSFTATPVNGGANPAFQWRVNGTAAAGATNASYSYVPVNSDAVSCVVTSNALCPTGSPATSNTITLTVNPLLPVSVSIASSGNTVCAGTTVSFTATPVNGGSSPAYQWRVNGNNVSGATGATYSYVPVNGDAVSCVLTSNALCPTGSPAVSNTITMTVNPLLPVSATIFSSANTVCAGTTVNFTSTVVNGGTSPSYQWRVNGTAVSGATASGYSFVPANGDAVSCLVTSNAVCPTGNPATSNTITITVNQFMPVSVTIASTGNTLCAGTQATCTATVTNGGASPAYQWKVNGNNVAGATNAAYTFTPNNGNTVACTVTSSLGCATGNPATSNNIVFTVNPVLPVSVSIASTGNTVCAGTSVSFTATPVNGGASPQYQWRVNGTNVTGATNASYSFVPVNGDAVTCLLTSSIACPTGNPATSNAITMTVNPLLPVSISIASTGNTVCAGTTVSFTATPVNGGANPAFQWRVNGTAVSGATNASYSYVPVNGDAVSCVLTSNALCPTGSPATSNTITLTVNPLLPVSVSIASSGNTVCAGTMVSFTATPVNGGSSPAYLWKVNGNNVSGATGATYSYVPVNGDAVSCVLTSNALCPTGSPAVSNTITMTVNPLLPVSATIFSSANTVCAGTTVNFTSTVVNGGTSPSYQWRVNGTTVSGATASVYSYVPANGDVVSCLVTSNAVCPTGSPATSNTITITVNQFLPVSVTISSTGNTLCAGTQATCTATVTNGGASPAYQWKVNGNNVAGATNAAYTFTPNNGNTVACTVTSSLGCATGNPATSNNIVFTVNPVLPVSVSIASTGNTVCAGTSVSFTATPVNGGASPQYQWRVNGTNVTGATNASYSFVPVNGDAVTCVLTSSIACPTGNPATSNAITMTVNPLLPVSVSIASTGNTVCAGTTVSLTATPVNGGANPAFQWRVNGTAVSGATNSSYSYVPVNGDAVSCVLTSNALCPTGSPATSNTITLTVNPLLPVSVSITSSGNIVCAGTTVSFTATPVNGGSSPAYLWKVNGNNVSGATGATYSYVPVNGDAVSCVLTSNALCPTGNPATSNTITMTVNPLLPVSATIFSSANTVCAGTTVNFTSTVVNGGTSPSYQWRVNGTTVSGATASGYSYVPANGDAVSCLVTSNAVCPTGSPATSNIITITVNQFLPVSATISSTGNTLCAGTQATCTATVTNGGASPAYQWKVNGNNVAGATNAAYTFTPNNGNTVACTVTSSLGCATGNPATSNNIVFTVNPVLPVSVSIASTGNTVCAGTSVSFTATPVNGGASPQYQWRVNGTNVTGATNASYSFVPVNGDAVTCLLTSSIACPTGNPATSNAITMTVNPLLPVSVSIASTGNTVCAGTTVSFTATPVNGGANPAFQWRVNGTAVSGATNSSYSYVPVNGDAVSCVLTSNALCPTGSPATSNTITLTVNPLLPVSVSIASSGNTVCAGTTVSFTATPVNGGSSPAYQWKVNGNNVSGATGATYSYVPVNGDAVSCVLTSNALCPTGNPATSNTITMTVNPLLPVSATIFSSANTVCAGTTVNFTSTVVNGGTSPSYQWRVNGTAVSGATASGYSYVPANGDVVSCLVTSNAVCPTGSPATSNTITITVNQFMPVSVTIASTGNTLCAGTQATCTATVTNGGASPAYQWKVNGNNVAGATNAAYTFTPNNGNTVACTVTSSLGCATGNPATSNNIVFTVNPVLPVSVSIASTGNTVCAGTTVSFTATPSNGGSSPQYQWRVNGTNVTGATSASYSFVPVNGDAVTCLLTSSIACPTGNPATSNAITMTVNPLLPVSVSIASSGNTVCAGTTVSFTATPVNGGTSPLYQWRVNGTAAGGATNASYSYVPLNGDAVSCVVTSNALCPTGSPATSNTITLTVNPLLPVSVSIASSGNTVCAGTTVSFTATPVNGGSLPAYQWKVNGNNVSGATGATYSYVPVNGDAVSCVLTSNALCPTGNPATSNTITMTVNPLLPVSATIFSSANTVCAGTTVNFTSTVVNGGTSPSYQWRVNGTAVSGATASGYSFVPANGDAVSCLVTSNAVCPTGSPATSNIITITVNQFLPVSVTISSTGNTLCAGTQATCTATVTNGGASPAYQWKVNGNNVAGATNAAYTFTPNNGNTVACTVTSSLGCATGNPATSNNIVFTVNPVLPVSVSIASTGNTVCAGTSVSFTATPVNGGASPQYQWRVNGTNVTGATNASYSFVPVNGDAVTCLLTSSIACPTGNPATSNAITMTVNPLLPVSVSIASTGNTVCAGTTVSFTATPVNGGANPAYQWRVNGTAVSGATNSSYSYVPVNGDAVSCVVTSNALCPTGSPATSNTITLTVNPLLPVSVSIASSGNTVCAGTTVSFTATPVNGGSSPAYQWRVNGNNISGATGATYSYVPVNGDAVSCVLTSNALCPTGNPATSNTITMTVNPLLPVSATIFSSANTVCAGTTVNFTSTVVNGGTSPSFQWRVNGTAVSGATASGYSYVPANGDAVSCLVTSNAVCPTGSPATSNTIAMIVNPLLPVTVTISSPGNTVCAGSTVSFTATAVNGGTAPAYQWRVNGTAVSGATNGSFSYVPINGDAVTCMLTSSETCAIGNPATSNAIAMTVNPLLPVSVSIASTGNTVCAGSTVTFTATPVNGGTSPTYQWKVNGTNITGATNASYSYIPLNGNAVTCTLNSNALCPTGNPATSNTITMTVNPLLPVSVSITSTANTVCAGTTVSFTATAVNGGTSPLYQWRVNGTAVSGATNANYNYVPEHGDAVSCMLTSNAICPSGNPAVSNTITITVNPLEPVSVSVSSSETEVCAGTPVLFTATAVNGGTSPSWQWKINGAAIAGATSSQYNYSPANNDAVTCTLISNAVCPTGNPATSNTVTMTVNPLLPVSISIAASAGSVCAGDFVTFTANPVNGGNSPGFQWKVNGSDIPGATNSSFGFSPLNGDVVNCRLNSNITCPTGNPALSNAITMTVNPLLPVSVTVTASANPVCAWTMVTFSTVTVNGGTNPAYQWRVNGSDVAGATGSVYSYVPTDNDQVSCNVTSNATCATGNPAQSNVISMTVNPLLPVSINITPSANPVCAGTQVTFTSSVTNGGASPTFQWNKNGIPIGSATASSYSFVPVNNDIITCSVTSNAVCPTGNPAVSNSVSMTVNPLLPVSVSITASTNPVCAGTAVTYAATAVNGGTGPSYQWKVNGNNVTGATGSQYVYSPINGDIVTCSLESNAICPTGSPALSNAITMTVNPLLPVSLSIAASANPVCAGTQVTYTSSIVNGGSAPAYQWRKNGVNISGATNTAYTHVPVNGDAITCRLTSNATCATGSPAISNTVSMVVNPLLPVSVSIAASANPVCAGTEVTFTASPVNGGSAPVYQWRKNGSVVTGVTGASYSYIPVNGDNLSCTLTSNAVCPTGSPANSNTITMTVNPILPVSVSIVASSNPVCATTPVTFTATPVNGGTSPSYQWVVNGANVTGATNQTYVYAPVNDDIIKCILTSSLACKSGSPATSGSITMTVTPLTPVSATITASAYAVMPSTQVTYNATVTNGGTAPVYQWKVNNNNAGTNSPAFVYAPSNNDNIKCVVTSSLGGCLSGNPAASNVINMIVYSTGTPCSTAPTVIHGGMTYNSVQIGTQCWLRENMNIGTMIDGGASQANNGVIEKYCYDNNPLNCNTYGGLYQWAEMVQYLNGATNTTNWNPVPSGNVQGICPSGWHIPTKAEYDALIAYLGATTAAGKLKETGLVHWLSPNTGATNSTGFTAIGSGYIYNNASANMFYYSNYWTSTTVNASTVYYYGTPYNYTQVISGQGYKITGYSLRCLKN